MKIVFLLISFTVFFAHLFAQTYPCETTLMGKLVTKPLLKNGKINYELAVKDTTDPRAKNGKDITTIVDRKKEDGNVYVARHVAKGKLGYDLLFVSRSDGKCIYQVTQIGPDRPYGIRLNENGNVIDWDEHTPNSKSEQKNQEKLAAEWLKYFE